MLIAQSRHKGFTMIELVIVISIVSILSIVVAPKMFNIEGWRLRTFASQVQSSVMLANRLAFAQRRAITVSFTANTVTFKYSLSGLALTTPSTLTCPVANCMTAGVATFYTSPDGLTATSSGTTTPLQIQISSSRYSSKIIIDPQTGYVHKQ